MMNQRKLIACLRQTPATKSPADDAHGLAHVRNGADLRWEVTRSNRGKREGLMCTLNGANMSAISGCRDKVNQRASIMRRNTAQHVPAAVPAASGRYRHSRRL